MAKESTSPLMYEAKPATNLSELNQAGIGEDPDITKQRQKTLEANEDYASALEQRFRNPNWMKVSAAFLKPQLGGFGASLGSAFDVLGEQQEQQKAVAPTIAQIRAQNAVGAESLQNDLKAQDLLREAMKKPNGLTNDDVAMISKYSSRVGTVAQQKFTNQRGTFADLLSAFAEGRGYTQLAEQFGKSFVDSLWGTLTKLVPGRANETGPTGVPTGLPTGGNTVPSPSGTTTQTSATNPNGGTTPPRPLGVPESMVGNLTNKQTLETTSQQIADRIQKANDLKKNFEAQSTSALPIYQTAQEIYKLASHDYMKPAFGIFEKGDPMGILGTALERQDVSQVLNGMRDQIIKSRMNDSQKKSAMADLQTMENSLGTLQTQIQNGVINPTDVRTMFEAKSVPGLKNTQDSFLRGIASIGHQALGKYELNTVYNQFLNNPKNDVNNWQQSPEFTRYQDMMKKRGNAVTSNVAGSEPPRFLTQPLEQSYRHSYEPTTLTGATRRLTTAEARRLANGEQ